jgi:SAM-dependent methyltransferase
VAFHELKARLAQAWGDGDWDVVARELAPMHEHLVRALAPRPGERWLDVATGTGATALLAARAGADVTAQDLAPGMIARARAAAEGEGLEIQFDVGDAEDLPYEDASFDVVASAVGAILTPNQEAMAAQLARVCRPGGRLGLTAWRPGVGHFMFMNRFRPPPEPGAGDREEWGRERSVERLLGDAFELRFEEREFALVGATGEEMWERQLAGSGPVKQLYESFDDGRRRELREAAVGYFESERVGDEIRAPAPYLLILGTRR